MVIDEYLITRMRVNVCEPLCTLQTSFIYQRTFPAVHGAAVAIVDTTALSLPTALGKYLANTRRIPLVQLATVRWSLKFSQCLASS